MRELFFTFSWQDLRQHPWRSLAAALAVMLGVALGLAVHLINASALTEFAQATQAINGQSDVQLRARQGLLPQRFFAAVAALPLVAQANPVLEATVQAFTEAGHEVTLHLTGADALQLPATAPALMPRPWPGSARLVMLAPDALFLNASARKALHLADGPAVVQLQIGLRRTAVQVAGSVPATGQPVGVMDIGAAQDLLGLDGWLTRIDVRLRPGADKAALEQALDAHPDTAARLLSTTPRNSITQADQLSRAYRVNLTALALVALFTGAYLVYSVLALALARRLPQFALLGVLGATPRQRLMLMMGEAGTLGLIGAVAGVLLGTLLAWAALRLAGGDLGGG
ncbi:MAG: ABC transporter permease, partial [Comamonas sp.]